MISEKSNAARRVIYWWTEIDAERAPDDDACLRGLPLGCTVAEAPPDCHVP